MPTVETVDNTENAGEDITTEPFAIDEDITKLVKWVTAVNNGFDVSVTVTAEVTTADDPNFNKSISGAGIADAVGVASGASEFFSDADNVPWSYVRFTLSPGGDPTSGTLTVTTQRRRFGGE